MVGQIWHQICLRFVFEANIIKFNFSSSDKECRNTEALAKPGLNWTGTLPATQKLKDKVTGTWIQPSSIHGFVNKGHFPFNKEFGFKISDIPRAQWNGTFRLHQFDPRHRTFGHCSCKQVTKERYWEQQFCQRGISVWLTEMIRLVKVDHRPRWAQIFRLGWAEMVPFHLISNRNVRNFGLSGKRPGFSVAFVSTRCRGSDGRLAPLVLQAKMLSVRGTKF